MTLHDGGEASGFPRKTEVPLEPWSCHLPLLCMLLLRQAPPLSAQAVRLHDARDKLFYQSSEAKLGVFFDTERNERSLVAAGPPHCPLVIGTALPEPMASLPKYP